MSITNRNAWLLSWIILALSQLPSRPAAAVDVQPLLSKIRSVGAKGEGHREAQAAWQTLAKVEVSQLVDVLAGFDGDCGPLAANWIRAAAEAIADRAKNSGTKLPLADLEKFLANTSHSPRGRRVAYELIATVDQNAEQRLIPSLLNDPSLELRRDAVTLALAKAAASATGSDKGQTIALYREVFAAARDVDQIKAAAEKLKGLDEKTDTTTHMGFVLKWKIVAPFDNVDRKGFDVSYPPELGVDLKATYPGKENAKVSWADVVSEDSFGLVDLNKALAKHKGAIAYAFAEFIADKDRDVELRFGCINANKLWLNGQLLTMNNIYHAGREIDQYVGVGKLKKGRNEILLKVAQNEQTEHWAQDWQFQLRVCDQIGTAVLSQDRSVAHRSILNLK